MKINKRKEAKLDSKKPVQQTVVETSAKIVKETKNDVEVYIIGVKAEYKGRRVIENTTGGKYFTLVSKGDKGKRSTVKEIRMDLADKAAKFTKYRALNIVADEVCDKHISRINEVLSELSSYKDDDKVYQTTVYRTTVRNGFKNIISRADKKIEAMSA